MFPPMQRTSIPVYSLDERDRRWNLARILMGRGPLAGKAAAGSTQRRKRSVFYSALGYAVAF
jgi:hypothetical protein